VPAITAVFTLAAVAQTLGLSEDLLHDLLIEMEPEDGCIAVYGPGDAYTPAFTREASSTSRSCSTKRGSWTCRSTQTDRGPRRMDTDLRLGSRQRKRAAKAAREDTQAVPALSMSPSRRSGHECR
jgi:hypothetical protein